MVVVLSFDVCLISISGNSAQVAIHRVVDSDLGT